MEGTDLNTVSSGYKFRGSDFYVTMECKGSNSLMVEVEDRLTADQWRAVFDKEYIEDLTHKTGNYKQFNVFTSMLESAITQSSNSVSLDLLTYADLELLRQKKSAGSEVKSSIPASRSSGTLVSKRYLIVTYTVEFDRIHYPLPLPYVGKPDPRALQETIRQLRAENRKLKQAGYSEHRARDFEKLQRECQRLAKEKEEVEQEFMQYRREMRNTASGHAAKDLRTLKGVVRSLEQELMREKTEHQRAASKRGQEYRELLDEVEELRASERNLRVRVKSLTNELAVYRRGRQPSRTASRERIPSLDRLSKHNNSSSRQRSLSRERTSLNRQQRERSLSQDRLYAQKRYNRSSSRDRPSSAPDHSRRSDSPASVRGSLRLPRSPSPASFRRFDPTAYIKEQERRKREAGFKKKRKERANTSGVSTNSRPSPGSFNSSRHSEHAGLSLTYPTLASTPDSEFGKRRSVIDKENQGPVSGDESELFDRSAEISEIDERLNRLQQLMKATMP
ncbi:hypothetical protein BaRGS_00032525 [Batillaria attramentaria]|uniref:Centrosomal protein CCDC61 n=1 Tax=Batillaria attramentaria TaxID=370345 RepID=A0ABD0JN25_9CAEN